MKQNKKHKPNPKWKALTPKWYNPLFWIGYLLATIFMMGAGALDELIESYNDLRSWDLS